MTPLLLLAGAALCAVFVGRLAFVALHRRRRSQAHPSVLDPRIVQSFCIGDDCWSWDWNEHVDPDGFVVEDTGLGWDGSKGP